MGAPAAGASGEPSAREYRCKFTDCRLTLSGEFREPRVGDHFLSNDFGATQAAIDFDIERPILRHVGEPTAKCKEYHARWGRPSQDAAGVPEPKAQGPSPSHVTPTLEAPRAEGREELIAELVVALEAVKVWRGVGVDSLEHFEAIGEMFYVDTGFLRPGKSEPMESYSEDREERKRVAWQEWCQRKNAELDVTIAAALAKAGAA